MADWHWEPVTDDLLDGLPPAALAAVRQVAEELTYGPYAPMPTTGWLCLMDPRGRVLSCGAAGSRPQPDWMERLIPVAEAGQDLRALSLDGLKRARRES